jgi:type I restriction enzyme S subunit
MKQNWEHKNLGDVCEIVNGSTPLRTNKDFWQDGNFPWFTIDDIREQGRIIRDTKQKVTQTALKKLRILPVDTVLLCCTASIGEYALTEIELTTNQQFNGLVIKNKKELYPMFLMYFSSTLKDTLSNLSGKATIDFIPISKLKDIEIPLPSLPEQQQIVAILDEAFAAIAKVKANAEQNLKNTKELFESFLQGVFENKGEGWEKKTLKELTTHLGDGLHGTPKYTLEGDYYFINGNNLTNGLIEFKSSTKRVSFEEYNKHKKNLTDRTILVSINGTLGNVAFYNNEKIILGKSACYFNMKDSVDKNYMKYVLSSPYFLTYAHKEATGATIKNISLKTMRDFIVPLPAISEQKAIVQKLDALSDETKRLEAIYQQKINDLEELKKSVLQKAFNGELTIKN